MSTSQSFDFLKMLLSKLKPGDLVAKRDVKIAYKHKFGTFDGSSTLYRYLSELVRLGYLEATQVQGIVRIVKPFEFTEPGELTADIVAKREYTDSDLLCTSCSQLEHDCMKFIIANRLGYTQGATILNAYYYNATKNVLFLNILKTTVQHALMFNERLYKNVELNSAIHNFVRLRPFDDPRLAKLLYNSLNRRNFESLKTINTILDEINNNNHESS